MNWDNYKEIFESVFGNEKSPGILVSMDNAIALIQKPLGSFKEIERCAVRKFKLDKEMEEVFKIGEICFRPLFINLILEYFKNAVISTYLSEMTKESGEKLSVLVFDLGDSYIILASMVPEDYLGEHGRVINEKERVSAGAAFLL